MKRKFYFHRVNEPLAADSVIYRLWVGESVREQRLLTKIVAWSFEHGATIMSWCEDIDYYLMIERERIFTGAGLLDFGFIQQDITAAEALQHILDQDWEAFEKSLTIPKNLISDIRLNSPCKIIENDRKVIPSHVLSSPRYHLSRRGTTERYIIRFI